MTRRKAFLLTGLAAVLVIAAAVLVLHSRPVQDRIWKTAVSVVDESTGLHLTAVRPTLRLLPGRIDLQDVLVSDGDRVLATARSVEVEWKWRFLLSTPRRIERIAIDTLRIESTDLPRDTAEDQGPVDLEGAFGAMEIGEMRISGGSAFGAIEDIELSLSGLELAAHLVQGRAKAAVEVDSVQLRRSGRDLALGQVILELEADPAGLVVQTLEVKGPVLSIVGRGSASFAESGRATADLGIGADLAPALAWWDPNLVSGLDPAGLVDLEGTIELDSKQNLSATFDHRGEPFRVAGYDIQDLAIEYRDEVAKVELAHPSWGSMAASLDQDSMAEISARLDRAPVDQLMAFAVPQVAQIITGPASLSGNLDARVGYPAVLSDVAAKADLRMDWANGAAVVVGEGTGLDWRASEVAVRVPGVRIDASGRFEAGRNVDAEFRMVADRSEDLFDRIQAWVPQIGDLGLAGGRLSARGTIRGRVEEPRLEIEAAWSEPVIAGTQLAKCEFSLSGDLDRADWDSTFDLGGGSVVRTDGVLRPKEATAQGRWSIDVADIAGLVAFATPEAPVEATGELLGAGQFGYGEPSGPRLSGEITGLGIEVDDWRIERAFVELDAQPARVVLNRITVAMLDGTIEGSADLDLPEGGPRLVGRLQWTGLELSKMPLPIPDVVAGQVAGSFLVDGRLDDPEIDVDLRWVAAAEEPLVGDLNLTAAVRGGVCTVLSSQANTAAGPVMGEAEVPIGAFERPGWLWPDAPSGAVRASLTGSGLRSGPLARVLGQEDGGIEVWSDLRVDVGWDPAAGSDPQLILEADGLKVVHKAGEMIAQGPLVVRLDGRRLEIDPIVMDGPSTRIEAEAVYDPASNLVEGRLRAHLAPIITKMIPLPVPVQMDGPITISADLSAPPSIDLWGAEARGALRIDHRGGTIAMRDPPLQIVDLVLDATIAEGRLTIDDGRATVNRGTVELAGGWDPASGQGVVADIDNVTVFTAGVLTKWDGVLAVEPHPERIANVAGDLTLLAGLWDESVALTGTFFGEDPVDLPADDPLREISLDVAVRGRSGIRVDNNLGRFDVAWDVIRVGGSAAEPVIEGEVRIAPGGTIAIAGNRIKVRRGSLEFTGNPAIDPVVEIVPESEGVLYGSETEGGVDATLMATKGLATGLSSALGFENETLQPAEIAVQIERDPSVQFMIGQRLTRNLALFFGANLTDVQDRTTMIQAWNFRGLKGLIFQAYQETIDSNLGFNVMQQFRWGGTPENDERATIHRFRFEGDWPLSKRSLRKSTRLRRGQPFDPFLLFVSAVRMERLLAENGYQTARVRVTQTGPPESPSMVFSLDQGVRQLLEFSGDAPQKSVQREATSLYRPPPLETRSLANIEAVVRRHLVTEGFLAAEVTVSRADTAIRVDVIRGEKSTFSGPVIDGLSLESSVAVQELLGSKTALALAVNDPERVGRSIERLLAADGYLEARVERVWVDSEVSGSPVVRIEVSPGPREEIGEIVLVGTDPLGILDGDAFGLRPGQPLDRSVIDGETRAVRRAYERAGYRESRVQNRIYEDDGGWVVVVDLSPGRQRTINNIVLTGSRGISDRVLRNGLVIEDGAVLTDADLDASASQIANFAPVERVDVTTEDRGESEVDVEFNIVKRKRWRAEVGGGWSSERGLQGRFGLVDGNLLRRGVTLNLRGSFDSVDQRLFMIGSMPAAPGSRLSLISTLGYSIGDAPDEPDLLEQDEVLASLEAQYAVTRGASLGVYYRWTNTHTYEKIPDDFFPFDIRLKIGVLGVRTVVDRYDNLFDPRAGFSLTSDLGWSADTIGSDLEYVSWLTNFGFVLSPFNGSSWLQTLRLGVSEPLKGTNLDREARFFAGGQSSIRGFDLNSVGPVTFGIDGSLVPAGGGALFILNEELRIPISGPLRAAVFADIGQVWESWGEADLELSIGVGAGVRWSTPVGPLWFDLAWPIENVGISSKKMKFYLGIGRTF